MKDADRQTRSRLMELFEQHGHHPRTDLGQNFLIDLNLVEYIVEEGRLGPRDVVLEIGAGTGGMTAFLAEYAAQVVSVEIDTNMFRLAEAAVGDRPNVTLLNRDALKTKSKLCPDVLAAVEAALQEDPERRLKLVANLPYSVATPVISNLVATELPWVAMVVTIQYELAQRLCSKPGRSQYGAISVWLQSQARVKILKKLGPTVFWPRPQVDSAIVRLTPDPRRRSTIQDRVFLLDFLRRLFHQRRKAARSVLVGMYRKQLRKPEIDAVLTEQGISGDARAEQLGVDKLIALANGIQKIIGPQRDDSPNEP